MASAAVHSKGVILLLLLIHCLLLLPLFVGILCMVLVVLSSTKCPFWFCNHLAEEERASFLTLIIGFLISCFTVL